METASVFSRKKTVITVFVMLVFAVLLGLLIANTGIAGAAGLLVLPFAVLIVAIIFLQPKWGIVLALIMSFLANGLVRYLPAPLGLTVDAFLLLTMLGVLFMKNKSNTVYANNPATWVFVIWFVYMLVELFNPEAISKEAWFYSVRGLSLYLLFAIPLTTIVMGKAKDFSLFLNIWLGFSAMAALWALKQKFIGLDTAEYNWLEQGGKITHIIQGQLRMFSFYSDAGQFGAAIGHAGLAATILGLGPVSKNRKLLYFALALLCFYGLIISGTRGALFVPISGFMVFFLLSKNFKVLSIGLMLGFLAFAFLKFTTIGQSNYNIRRMRTALDPNDPSLLVRKENQATLAKYLVDKPFGGGLGSGGSLGQRYAPDSFLAKIPFDSWYVKVWVETGIVGLIIHLACIIFILIWTFWPIFNCRNPLLKSQLAALYAGFFGVSFASYGNQIFGQTPTIIVISLSIAYLFMHKRLLNEYELATH